MKNSKSIPKGSDVYGNGVFMAKTTKDFNEGHFVMPTDFEPRIPLGTVIDTFEIVSNGKTVYIHPNFIE